MKNDKDPVYYLEKAPVSKAIRYMAVPMILGLMINVIYNLTDAFFIGMLDNTAMLAAITLSLPFMTILMGVGKLFGVGGSTYISRLLGEKNRTDTKYVSSVSIYSTLIFGTILGIACLLMIDPLLSLLGASGETWQYTYDYVMILAIGAPFIVANFCLEDIVRGEGASRVSMIGMLISVAINIVLDPIFIFTLDMGIMGAAIALVIGNLVAVAYYFHYLSKKSEIQSTSLKDFKPTIPMLSTIFKVGVSEFLFTSFLIVSTLVFNHYAMGYGDAALAGFGVAMRVSQVADMIGMGLAMSVIPLIAYAYSAKDNARLKEILRTTAKYMLVFTVSIGIVMFIFRTPIVGMFGSDMEMISIGTYALSVMLVSSLFSGFAGYFSGIFQAYGKGLPAAIISVSRGAMLIPLIIIGNALFQLDGVLISLLVAEIISFTIGFAMWTYSKKKDDIEPIPIPA